MSELRPEDPLHGFPVLVSVPVAWGEMDAFQHVNNTVYFRWFEIARIELLRRVGFAAPETNGGVGPILASTACRYRRPVIFPDHVRVGVRATEVEDDRFTTEYRVVSERQGALAAEGTGVIVAFDYEVRRKAALPERVRTALHALG